VASAIWYAILAFAGYELAENWEAVKSLVANTNRALALAAVVLTLAVSLWLWRRSRQQAE
jgi:membrane protein DedA with SNARE-associated domain